MRLGSKRKLLSSILFVIIAIAVTALLSSFIIGQTLANKSFLKEKLVSEELISECEAQLDMKFAALDAETGIPIRVFQTVKTEYGTKESLSRAIGNTFGAEDSSLYSNSLVDYFYDICTEYLDGNRINYNKTYVKNAAEKAARIYSDTVGLHNVDSVSKRYDIISENCGNVCFVSAIVIIFCVLIIIFLHSTRKKGMAYVLGAFSSGSVATAAASLLCIITKVGSKLGMAPMIYQASFESVIKSCFIYLMLLSFIIAVISYILMVYLIRNTHEKSD